jgi:hypothetical protein
MTDRQLIKLAWDVRSEVVYGSSRGCCVLAAPLLCERLQAAGVLARVAQGDVGKSGHLWVALPDGRILDATGDQFNWHKLPPVYLEPRPGCCKVKPKKED